MLKTVVKKGNYHDSVVLMLLTNHISTIEGVNKASIMMATPSNKDIFKQSGLDTPELMESSANDMVIVVDITEEAVNKYMYTYDAPDPDLIIRTAGEQRLSGFLIWQSAYSEFYFTDVLWPDFDEKELDKAIDEFNNRKRNFGK